MMMQRRTLFGLLLFLLAMVLQQSPVWAAVDQWSSFAFPGMRVFSIAIDPSNSATLYTSTFSVSGSIGTSHLFRSTDSGRTWSEADMGLLLRESVFFPLLIDPSNPSVIVTDAAGIYLSNDRAESWLPVQLPFEGGCPPPFLFTLDSIGHLYAGLMPALASGEICDQAFKVTIGSDDDAILPLTGVDLVLADRRDPSIIFAGVTLPEPSIVKSIDGGATWTPFVAPFGSAAELTEAPWDAGGLYAIPNGIDPGLWRSETISPRWTELSSGIGSLRFASVLPDPVRAWVMYGVGYEPSTQVRHVIRSDDGGRTWSLFEAGLPSGLPPDVILTVDPFGRRLYASTNVGGFSIDLPVHNRIVPGVQAPVAPVERPWKAGRVGNPALPGRTARRGEVELSHHNGESWCILMSCQKRRASSARPSHSRCRSPRAFAQSRRSSAPVPTESSSS